MPAVRRKSSTRASVIQYRSGEEYRRQDWLSTEEPLEIRVVPWGAPLPGLAVSVTMRTPGSDFELAGGFLYTEGIIPAGEAIHRITYCVSDQDGSQQYNIVNVFLKPGLAFEPERLKRNFYMTSSCGVCGKASLDSVQVRVPERIPSLFTVSPQVILALPERLRSAQAVFDRTGGLHAAALCTRDGAVVAVREDVGRHNAVDKLIGHALLHRIDLTVHLLMVSGRTSFEIMQKAAVAGIPVVVAISAPSSLAVDLAENFGTTLVGFMREGRFNIYAGADRIRECESGATPAHLTGPPDAGCASAEATPLAQERQLPKLVVRQILKLLPIRPRLAAEQHL